MDPLEGPSWSFMDVEGKELLTEEDGEVKTLSGGLRLVRERGGR